MLINRLTWQTSIKTNRYIMKNYLTRAVKKILRLYSSLIEVLNFGEVTSLSYAQEGEDMVLKRIFNNQLEGFYVDVGAHHPVRFSNTYGLYKLGWKGINIEPNPDSFNLFKQYRLRDINLNCGVAKKNGSLEYYMFDEPALNTFDNGILRDRIQSTDYKLMNTVDIEVVTLASLLNKHLPDNMKVDYLTVDVEGLDLEVLQSNDWVKFRPKWVLVEQLNLVDIESLDFEIHHFMKSINYALFAKTFNTLFYKEQSIFS
jgi:FkbM family methyltransferase